MDIFILVILLLWIIILNDNIDQFIDFVIGKFINFCAYIF